MMDILRPHVMWIEGRCYRVNDPAVETTTFQEYDLYENEIAHNDVLDEGDDDDFEVVMMDNSRYTTSVHVSKHYLGSIIGKKGAIKIRIERDTKTDIKIPRQGQEGDIVIFGPTASSVKAARRRINIIVMSSRMKQKSTHFISIPMNQLNIQKRFEEFQYWSDKKSAVKRKASARDNARRRTGGGIEDIPELTEIEERIVALMGGGGFATGDVHLRLPVFDEPTPVLSDSPSILVGHSDRNMLLQQPGPSTSAASLYHPIEVYAASVLRDCPSRNLDQSLFIKPNKLHLTLGVMCLMDNEERLFASKLLTEAKEKVIMPILIGHMPLKIRLKGLSYMNDDPSQIDVLYGLVQEEGNSKGLIQELADALVEHFYKAGFMDREHGRDSVKLHVTLINSKYRSRSESANVDNSASSARNARRPRETFDGTEVLKKFADYDFGVAELTEIHLSQRHSVGPDGFYQATCVIPCK